MMVESSLELYKKFEVETRTLGRQIDRCLEMIRSIEFDRQCFGFRGLQQGSIDSCFFEWLEKTILNLKERTADLPIKYEMLEGHDWHMYLEQYILLCNTFDRLFDEYQKFLKKQHRCFMDMATHKAIEDRIALRYRAGHERKVLLWPEMCEKAWHPSRSMVWYEWATAVTDRDQVDDHPERPKFPTDGLP